jgi:hypothetical protein
MKQTYIFINSLSIIIKQFCCKEIMTNKFCLVILKNVSKFILATIFYIFYTGASFFGRWYGVHLPTHVLN